MERPLKLQIVIGNTHKKANTHEKNVAIGIALEYAGNFGESIARVASFHSSQILRHSDQRSVSHRIATHSLSRRELVCFSPAGNLTAPAGSRATPSIHRMGDKLLNTPLVPSHP